MGFVTVCDPPRGIASEVRDVLEQSGSEYNPDQFVWRGQCNSYPCVSIPGNVRVLDALSCKLVQILSGEMEVEGLVSPVVSAVEGGQKKPFIGTACGAR